MGVVSIGVVDIAVAGTVDTVGTVRVTILLLLLSRVVIMGTVTVPTSSVMPVV